MSGAPDQKHEYLTLYDIRLNETEFRNVFRKCFCVQLTNSILSGKIYVSPWHMQSVYNSRLRFDSIVAEYMNLAALG